MRRVATFAKNAADAALCIKLHRHNISLCPAVRILQCLVGILDALRNAACGMRTLRQVQGRAISFECQRSFGNNPGALALRRVSAPAIWATLRQGLPVSSATTTRNVSST